MLQENKNILAELDSLDLSSGSDIWTLTRAVASTFSDSELLDYYCSPKGRGHSVVIKSILEKRDSKRLAACQHRTIGEKIAEFSQKKRGYSYLRTELARRYNFASKADRRKIVEALLTENRQDRIQAYSLMNSHWDSYFTDKLVSLYNQYHDNESLILFIKHYPRTFLNSSVLQ